jgi:hypothetical protein
MPVIPVTLEEEAGGLRVQGQPRQSNKTLSQKQIKIKGLEAWLNE